MSTKKYMPEAEVSLFFYVKRLIENNPQRAGEYLRIVKSIQYEYSDDFNLKIEQLQNDLLLI